MSRWVVIEPVPQLALQKQQRIEWHLIFYTTQHLDVSNLYNFHEL